jgi:hypothetical protein
MEKRCYLIFKVPTTTSPICQSKNIKEKKCHFFAVLNNKLKSLKKHQVLIEKRVDIIDIFIFYYEVSNYNY